MRLLLLLPLLFSGLFLQAQRTLTILPTEVAVFEDQKVNIFRLKRDLTKAVMAGQEDTLQSRYEVLIDAAIYGLVSESAQQLDYVRSEEEMPEDLQFDFFRMRKLLADGEMNRRETKKMNWANTSGGLGRGMSHKKWKAANEENLLPLAQKFGAFFNSRYLLMLRFHGQHMPDKRDTPNIYGGAKYQLAIVDTTTGEVVYYNSTEQGRKQETVEESKKMKINIPKEITPKMIDKCVEQMLDAAIAKHRSLVKAMEKERN